MSDAIPLVARIRSDLKPLEARICGHAYLNALEEHSVHPESLKVFVGQQHHVISSDLRSIALILSRQGMLPSRRFWINVLQGEAAALDALHALAGTLGLEPSDLEVFEPLPAAHAYCTFVAWLALYGSDAELVGALLVNFRTWGACCHRMRKALHQKYDMAPSALAFFDLFADMPSFENEALSILQNGLDRGIPERLIHRAARMLQGYELMFWDAMARATGVPLNGES